MGPVGPGAVGVQFAAGFLNAALLARLVADRPLLLADLLGSRFVLLSAESLAPREGFRTEPRT